MYICHQDLMKLIDVCFQIGRLVANVCTTFTAEGMTYSQVAQAPARRAAKELWEAVTEIYTASTQQKRTGSGATNTLQRESNKGILPTQAFLELIKKLQVMDLYLVH